MPVVRDAIVQRFESTVKLAGKLVEAWLAVLGSAVQSLRAVRRAAYAVCLPGGAADADVRLRMLEYRKPASQTDREDLAIAIAARVRAGYAAPLRALAQAALGGS